MDFKRKYQILLKETRDNLRAKRYEEAAHGYEYLGYFLTENSKFNKAIENYQKAEEIYLTHPEIFPSHFYRVGRISHKIANCYSSLNLTDQKENHIGIAIDYFKKALKETDSDPYKAGKCYYSMAECDSEYHNSEHTKTYLRKAAELFLKSSEEKYQEGDYETAIFRLEKALNCYITLGDQQATNECQKELVQLHLKNAEVNEKEDYFENKIIAGKEYEYAAEILEKLGKRSKAREYRKKAKALLSVEDPYSF